MRLSVKTLICFLGFAAGACAGHEPVEAPIMAALRATDQPSINAFTDQFLYGGGRFDAVLIRDNSPQHIYIRVTEGPGTGITHLGVERMGDYFLCLLELRFSTTTETILAQRKAPLDLACQQDGCGICASETWPVSDRIRATLVGYWNGRRTEWATR
jgi:hypothetical protein